MYRQFTTDLMEDKKLNLSWLQSDCDCDLCRNVHSLKVENVYFSLSLFELRRGRDYQSGLGGGRARHDVKKELWIRLGPLLLWTVADRMISVERHFRIQR